MCGAERKCDGVPMAWNASWEAPSVVLEPNTRSVRGGGGGVRLFCGFGIGIHWNSQ